MSFVQIFGQKISLNDLLMLAKMVTSEESPMSGAQTVTETEKTQKRAEYLIHQVITNYGNFFIQKPCLFTINTFKAASGVFNVGKAYYFYLQYNTTLKCAVYTIVCPCESSQALVRPTTAARNPTFNSSGFRFSQGQCQSEPANRHCCGFEKVQRAE